MSKNKLLKELNNIEEELLNMEYDLTNNGLPTDLNSYYYKWKQDIIASELTTNMRNAKSLKNENDNEIFKIIISTGLIIILLGICAILLNSLILYGLTFIIDIILYLKSWQKIKAHLTKIPRPSFFEYLNDITKLLEKNQTLLNSKNWNCTKNDKKLDGELIIQMFDEASTDLEKMVDSKVVNLNYKDREYRRFIIDLYNLKISEKEFNNFYREIIKTILEEDLKSLRV